MGQVDKQTCQQWHFELCILFLYFINLNFPYGPIQTFKRGWGGGQGGRENRLLQLNCSIGLDFGFGTASKLCWWVRKVVTTPDPRMQIYREIYYRQHKEAPKIILKQRWSLSLALPMATRLTKTDLCHIGWPPTLEHISCSRVLWPCQSWQCSCAGCHRGWQWRANVWRIAPCLWWTSSWWGLRW